MNARRYEIELLLLPMFAALPLYFTNTISAPPLIAFHVGLLSLLGFVYHFAPSTKKLAPQYRVHPIWFLPMAVMMPTAYVILTPLGLFTLHSSSWETRGHGAVVQGTQP